MEYVIEGAHTAGSLVDIQTQQEDYWQVALVVEIKPNHPQLQLFQANRKAEDLLEIEGTSLKKAPFRTQTTGIPKAIKAGMARFPTSIVNVRNIIGGLESYNPEVLSPRDIVQLLRGRHPFSLESLMMSDHLSPELNRTLKDYVKVTVEFVANYLYSVKFEDLYEIATSKEATGTEIDDFEGKMDNPYRSSTAAHQSSYGELLDSMGTAIYCRERVRYYCSQDKQLAYEHTSEMKRIVGPILMDSFVPKVTAGIVRLTQNAASLCPLRLIYSLMVMVSNISTKHDTGSLFGPLTELAKALLRLHQKTIDQLDKLPVERMRWLLADEKWVPDSFIKSFGEEIKQLAIDSEMRYFPLYPKLGPDGIGKFMERLGRMTDREGYGAKFTAVMETHPIIEYLVSLKESFGHHVINKLWKDLSEMCSGNNSLLEKATLLLMECNQPPAGQALADLLSKAPMQLRQKIMSELESGLANQEESMKFLKFAMRLAQNINTEDNVRKCVKIALRYMNNYEEVLVELLQLLEKYPPIALEVMTSSLELFATASETECNFRLTMRLEEQLKDVLIEEHLLLFKNKLFATIEYHLHTAVDRVRRRLINLLRISQRCPLTTSELLRLIDIFEQVTYEPCRILIINRCFLKDQELKSVHEALTDHAQRKLMTALENIGLKDLSRLTLYAQLNNLVYNRNGSLSYGDMEQQNNPLELLVESLVKIQDRDVVHRIAEKICKSYFTLDVRQASFRYRRLLDKVLADPSEQGYYLLGMMKEYCANEHSSSQKTPTKHHQSPHRIINGHSSTAVKHPARPLQENPQQFTQFDSTDQASAEWPNGDSRLKFFQDMVQEYFMKIFEQLPPSWPLLNRLDCRQTPLASEMRRAASKQQWACLFNGCFHRRYFLLKIIPVLRISTRQLEDTGALDVFMNFFENEHLVTDKLEYNSILLEMLQDREKKSMLDQANNTALMAEVAQVLIAVFKVNVDWLRLFDRTAVQRLIEAAFRLMDGLSTDCISTLLSIEQLVPLTASACLVDVYYIVEPAVKKLQDFIDRSPNWYEAINSLLNFNFSPDSWAEQFELLRFTAIFLKESDVMRKNDQFALQILLLRILPTLQEGTAPEHVVAGNLDMLRSILTNNPDLVSQLSLDLTGTLGMCLQSIDRDVFYLAFELLGVLSVRQEFRQPLVIELTRCISNTFMWGTHCLRDEIGQRPHRNMFVGLENPSCICYMNSFLQQLFSIKEFGEALLRCSSQLKPRNFQDILTEMKYCWLNLRDSKAQSFSNDIFYCYAYKNIDGSSVNVSQQMDADEFGKNLFDQLEKKLPKDNNVVSQFFQGQLQTTIASEECEHRSSRCQPFVSLELGIASTNFHKALEQLTNPEILEGDNAYSCDQCNRKVRARKSTKLKKMPSVLICVLKRFEYNREMGMRHKLNSLFEFPTDSFTVTRTLCEQEQPTYRLRGTVVHAGTSEAGHYFSFVKERDIWYLMDDNRVERTNSLAMKHRTFGSDRTYQSAYILFYEKVDANYGDLGIPNSKLYPDVEAITEMQQQIHSKSMFQLAFSKELSEYVDFLISKDYRHSPEVVCFLWTYFFNVRINTTESPQQLFGVLNSYQFQLGNTDPRLLQVIIGLQVDNHVQLKHYALRLLSTDVKRLNMGDQIIWVNWCILMSYINSNSNYIYLFLAHLAHNNQPLVACLIKLKLVGRIMDVFMTNSGFTNQIGQFEKEMRNLSDLGFIPPDEPLPVTKHVYDRDVPRYCWVLLEILLRGKHELLPQQTNRIRECSKRYFKKVFEDAVNKPTINRISAYLALMSKEVLFSENLISFIEREVKQTRVEGLRPYFRVLMALCKIEDGNSETRIKHTLKIFLQLLNEGTGRTSSSPYRDSETVQQYRGQPRLLFELAIQWLIRLLKNVRPAIQVLRKIPGGFKWLERSCYKPYSNAKIYHRHLQLNDLTRNILHGLRFPTRQSEQEQLYREFQSFFQKILIQGPPPIFAASPELDSDMLFQQIDQKRKLRYFKEVQRHHMEIVSCSVSRVFGQTVFVQSDIEIKQHTYEQMICYQSEEESQRGENSNTSTDRTSSLSHRSQG